MIADDAKINVTAQTESAERFPAVYSQGFAVVRVVALANPDDPGPLAVPVSRASADNDDTTTVNDDDLCLKPVA